MPEPLQLWAIAESAYTQTRSSNLEGLPSCRKSAKSIRSASGVEVNDESGDGMRTMVLHLHRKLVHMWSLDRPAVDGSAFCFLADAFPSMFGLSCCF